MKRKFVESTAFQKAAEAADTGFLRLVQNTILRNPAGGDLIPGTGGVRKIRVPGEGRGKSGGYRILYLDLAEVGECFLLACYHKTVKVTISAGEKKILKELAGRLKKGTLK